MVEICQLAKVNLRQNIELFHGYSFHVVALKGENKALAEKGFITRRMVIDTLTPMIEVCGGKIHRGLPKDGEEDKVIIIGPDTDCPTAQSLVVRNFRVMKREFIWSSIIRQRVDFSVFYYSQHPV
ncbi:hypothetical protein BGZ65_000590 [Modicella reniformis]|uniref:BRCT domain-containing protein n=1 Tax=Modicella reniformis TaxID=1440133 RepID=A0A9P6IFW2_9FUNG|nr:hypothetical protein BGZ65_000590 [Modicella reniformis]